MLYRTHHHPFSLHIQPFFPLFFITPSNSSSSPNKISSFSQKMDCVQGALVSGFGSEPVPKTAPFTDDDLFVDELLDFSNEEEETEEEQPRKLDELVEKENNCSFTPVPEEKSDVSDFGPLPETELSVPAEGLESLEWLSHFVEDSFSDYSLAGKLTSTLPANRAKPETPAKEQACFSTPVQTKARTKRARTGVRVWPVLSPSFTESSTSSSSSTSSATSFLFPPPPVPVHSGEFFIAVQPAPAKKQRKKIVDAAAGVGQPRRCSHCGVTKTPQWRAGPHGSKTLCNACGVRFKSGRLLPEYRPACSPTFSSEVHSNNHRKVMEMRRKKESEVEPAAGLPHPVQSF